MRDHRGAVGCILLALTVLTGCSSVVQGEGSASLAPSPTDHSTSAPQPSPTPSGSSTTGTPISTEHPRQPVDTAIGDPAIADLCSGFDVPALMALGYRPTRADVVFPPGCAYRMNSGTQVAFTVSVYATQSGTETTGTHTTRTESGLTVNVYPYNAKSLGNCERDLLILGAVIKIQPVNRDGGSEKGNCAAADATARSMAAAVASHSIKPLSLADPSVSSLDFCDVLAATDIKSDPTYAAETLKPDGLSAGCQITSTKVSFYIDFVIADLPRPESSTAKTVGSHTLYAGTANDDSFCTYDSTQGSTADGRYERVSVSLTVNKSKGSTNCEKMANYVGDFLDEAGLK